MDATQISMLDSFSGNKLVGVKAGNNKWGVINEKGDWLIKPIYADLEINETNYIIAAKCDDGINFKYGVIDTENNVLIPFENESIAYPHVFELNGKLHMLYLGNQVGRFGFGWAILNNN